MSFVQGAATQVKRFACDRCHGQKLRCPRPVDSGDSNAPCIRCQKAGTVCNISTPLKTGRPSKALKLQASTDSHPRNVSPSLSRASSAEASVVPTTKTKASASRRAPSENITNKPLNISSTPSSYPSSISATSPTKEGFRLCDDNSTPMVMDEYTEFFDFNLDFSDSVDMNFFGKTNEKEIWDFTMPQCPSMIKSKSSEQINCQQYDPPIQPDSARDEFLFQSPIDLNMSLLDDTMMVDDSTYSTPSSTHISPAERASRQSSCRPESRFQDTCYSDSDMAHLLEDTRMLFPTPCSKSSQPDKPVLEKQRRVSVSKSMSTLRTGIQEFGTYQTDELKQTRSMLQLQIEIYDCSATIIHPDTNLETDHQACNNQSGALGKLFCATEKFIKLISDTCSPQHPTTPQTSALPSPLSARSGESNNSNMASENGTSLKRGASSPALDGSFGSFMFNAMPSSKCEAAFSSTAAFHLMMACHTRLLTAYDIIINNIGSQLSNDSNYGNPPSSASLSIGTFTIESGTFLESRLHLQVISHQLSNLSDALRRALLSSRSQRRPEDFSSRATLRGLYQARRPATPPTLEESAMELVDEQEMILQMKIKKIKNISSEPQTSRRTRTRLSN